MGSKDNSLFEKKNENRPPAGIFLINVTSGPALRLAARGPPDNHLDWKDFSTVSRLVRLSETPACAIFSVAPAAAVVSRL